MSKFVAIDFETANENSNSACSVGLVRVENDAITAKKVWLIRPPDPEFTFTHVHGLTWDDVKNAPPFAKLWPKIKAFLTGAEFLVAHNAEFDEGVLSACVKDAGILAPPLPFKCTVKLSRQVLGMHRAKLSIVCQHLGIPLNHHEALSDAVACAKIVLAANSSGSPQFAEWLGAEKATADVGSWLF